MNRLLSVVAIILFSSSVFSQELNSTRYSIPVQDVANPSQSPHLEVSIQETPVSEETLQNASELLVTTDQETVLREFSQKESLLKKTTIVPFGKLVKQFQNTKMAKLMRDAGATIGSNIRKDKIGFMLVTYTTAVDTFYWYHVTTLDELHRTGNIFFSVVMAAVFGINKDAWANTARPITQKIKSYFKNSVNWERNSMKELAVRFSSSLILASAFNLVRLPLLSPDGFLDAALSISNYTFPMLLSLLATISSFGWSEEIARIDEIRHPYSKFVGRTLMNFRSLIVGTWATTAALLNPDLFGIQPWVVLLGSGGGGMLFYMKYEALFEKIEALGKKAEIQIKLFHENLIHANGNLMCSQVLL
ncbi:MAG TPA: hypothetical protein VN132_02560 [Bdellovibrio sp.]|nr:hypothetical protein [Bdellovibrio sp.]